MSMQKRVYVEHKQADQDIVGSIISVDLSWEPRPFVRQDGTFVLRGLATSDQIGELKNLGFKVHVDDEQEKQVQTQV